MYECQIETCWKRLLNEGETLRSERFKCVVNCFGGRGGWKHSGTFVSCLNTRSYTCICSQIVDRYHIVEKNGVFLKVGKECIKNILSGEELEKAEKEMKRTETEEAEYRTIRDRKKRPSNRLPFAPEIEI